MTSQGEESWRQALALTMYEIDHFETSSPDDVASIILDGKRVGVAGGIYDSYDHWVCRIRDIDDSESAHGAKAVDDKGVLVSDRDLPCNRLCCQAPHDNC